MKKSKKSPSSIFVNPTVLDESTDMAELVAGQEEEIKRIIELVNKYAKNNRSRIIAYIGEYGAGKSVVLQKATADHSPVQFDIWQYSNDSQIWDNFTITAISSLTGKSKQLVAEKVDGESSNVLIRRPVITSIIFGIGYLAISYLLWELIRDFQFMRAFLIYALPSLFVILAFLGITKILPKEKSKISRTFQYENELISAINKHGKPVVVIVEDVDRTTNGTRFLESLHTFLHKNKPDIKQPVIILCPQKATSFGSVHKPTTGIPQTLYMDRLESSIKIYDSIINSWLPKNVSVEQVDDLLESLGNTDKLFVDLIHRIIDISSSGSPLTLRSMKFILREVYDFLLRSPNANPYLSLICVASRYVLAGTSTTNQHAVSDIILGFGRAHQVYNQGKPHKEIRDIILLAIEYNLEAKSTKYSKCAISIKFGYTGKEEFSIEESKTIDTHTTTYLGRKPSHPETLTVTLTLDRKYRRLIW